MKDPLRHSLRFQISILDYLQQHGWKAARNHGQEEVSGLCPFHRETQPSFYVNRRKQVFYCHGCQRGGGLRQLQHCFEGHLGVPDSVDSDAAGLLEQTYCFFEQQLPRNPQAVAYLRQRGICDPALIERMRIGYAPGVCLRAQLIELGYSSSAVLRAGLIDAQGRDRFFRCITFPLEESGTLYGRSIDSGFWRHRFLPGSKGGLYGWQQARAFTSLIVVEGLFDVAALWQAGFPQAVAALGSHLNPVQWTQLSGRRGCRVHLCFDADSNGSGQTAAARLSLRLREAGVEALRIRLPQNHDPASWFAAGALPEDFQRFLEQARP
jgi:DNA primase